MTDVSGRTRSCRRCRHAGGHLRPSVAKEMPSADWWDDVEIGAMLWAFRPNGSPYPPGSWEDLEYHDAIVRARDEAGAKDHER
jgi:hypothetical protein